MPTRSTCKACKGPIFRHEIIPGSPSGSWLHLREEDWVDDPHNADPEES